MEPLTEREKEFIRNMIWFILTLPTDFDPIMREMNITDDEIWRDGGILEVLQKKLRK